MAKQNSQALWGIFLFLIVSCKDSGTASSENKNRVTPASLEQTQSNSLLCTLHVHPCSLPGCTHTTVALKMCLLKESLKEQLI